MPRDTTLPINYVRERMGAETNDVVPLREAIAEAGADGIIELDPNRVYLISNLTVDLASFAFNANVTPGVRINGKGAAIAIGVTSTQGLTIKGRLAAIGNPSVAAPQTVTDVLSVASGDLPGVDLTDPMDTRVIDESRLGNNLPMS